MTPAPRPNLAQQLDATVRNINRLAVALIGITLFLGVMVAVLVVTHRILDQRLDTLERSAHLHDLP